MDTSIQTIDEYILQFAPETQTLLQKVRETIQQTAPQTKEAIKYAMPTFVMQGNLLHFAAHKNHIGFYPAPATIIAFAEELKPYKTSKGAVQFPFSKAIPLELITRMVKYRVKEHLEELRLKKESKAGKHNL
ncbi:MAG: DUF1801 domain-containing protein [Lentimicrobium sp.]|nr:DUF1801 domain-containing protein [Lentimicrobium sp.]